MLSGAHRRRRQIPSRPGVEIPSGWIGHVAYAVDKGGGEVVLVEAWVPAEHLRPA